MSRSLEYEELLDTMTLEEKAALLSGASEWTTREIKRLGISAMVFSDGPNGVRRQKGNGDHLGFYESVPSTCVPTAAALACSWDEELLEEIGYMLGVEAQIHGVDILLGPGLNIKRNPLGGRNFEYFSEDPYASGKLAAAMIRGIQKSGISACPKHFAVNSQELHRMTVDSVLDERTLREIYLTGFEIALLEGQADVLMTSYNKINGIYANENPHLLLDILRKEWGFNGMVVTDWGGSNDHQKGVLCRSNIEMPGHGYDSAYELIEAVRSGKMLMKELDTSVADVLKLENKIRQNRREYKRSFDIEKHHELAGKAARNSIVLLKNEGIEKKILPISSDCKVALIGELAQKPRYQGAGSSKVNPTKLETIEMLIKSVFPNCIGVLSGYSSSSRKTKEEDDKALCLAEQSDIIIYCLGLEAVNEAEGVDRKNLQIPEEQKRLLEKIYQVNPNIVAVISAGSVIDMEWECFCRGILLGHLGGQASAGAVLQVLAGNAEPSGRLSESWPIHYEDTPSYSYFPGKERTAEYREGIFVGYRYYDKAEIQVRYPFGYGLSYTEFVYEDLKISEKGISFMLKNIGKRKGTEVVQLYVGLKDSQVYRAKKELKGFAKVCLAPGERRVVKIPFDSKTFRFWNTEEKSWDVESGVYDIFVGSNVGKICLEGHIEILGSDLRVKGCMNKKKLPSYFGGQVKNVSANEYEMLLGRSIPKSSWEKELGINDALCQMYYAKNSLARWIFKIIEYKKCKNERDGELDLNTIFIYNIPFRGLAKMTQGIVNMKMASGLVEMVNGHIGRGMRTLIIGMAQNRRRERYFKKKLSGKANSGKRVVL